MVKVAPFGSWKSPISAQMLVAQRVGLGYPTPVGEDSYWLESRPQEAGRQVIVHRAADGTTHDVNPAPYNARTRVHEYGGQPFIVDGETVYLSNFADQRLYRVAPGADPAPLTAEGDVRYADYIIDRARNRLIAVQEDHTRSEGDPLGVSAIASVDLTTGAAQVLVAGRDFYSNPRLSPDGKRLLWLQWDYPNMPWDGCELWWGEMAPDGAVQGAQRIAGGKAESIYQPEWGPEGSVYYVSDRGGWWNFYRHLTGPDEALCPMEAEFGKPAWVLGTRTYAFIDDQSLLCAYSQDGLTRLARLDLATRRLERYELPYTGFDGVQVAGEMALFVVSSPSEEPAVVQLHLATGAVAVLRRAGASEVGSEYLSLPQPIAFPTAGGLTAHAFYYAPHNADFVAPKGEMPPLIVRSHGGPTSATSADYNLGTQFWTSRGVAIVDVNYGGSTGYGRAYRERLKDKWGIVDVDDCCNAALYLVRQGLVDPKRLAIAGGSAGGFTTLAALTFRRVFAAGASRYGIGDLEALARDTHKFESRYLDGLVGPYPARRDLYLARSPIYHVDRLNCPMILLQGAEDKVVPPNQAEMMYEAVKKKGLPVACLLFAGEQHGFRQAKNIVRANEAELYFFARVFGFELAEPVEPITIDNLP